MSLLSHIDESKLCHTFQLQHAVFSKHAKKTKPEGKKEPVLCWSRAATKECEPVIAGLKVKTGHRSSLMFFFFFQSPHLGILWLEFCNAGLQGSGCDLQMSPCFCVLYLLPCPLKMTLRTGADVMSSDANLVSVICHHTTCGGSQKHRSVSLILWLT